jgi:hypothetical protein
MVNYNALKKELEEIVLISGDFLNSKLAKELVLKDDEKTPKPINEKIEGELEEMLNLKNHHLNSVDLETLPIELFSEDFKMNFMVAKTDIEESKKDIQKNFNFSVFDVLEIVKSDGSYSLKYSVNEKYKKDVYIVFILATDVDNPKKQFMYGSLKGGEPLPDGYKLGLNTFTPFTFEVVTNTGVKFNLK